MAQDQWMATKKAIHPASDVAKRPHSLSYLTGKGAEWLWYYPTNGGVWNSQQFIRCLMNDGQMPCLQGLQISHMVKVALCLVRFIKNLHSCLFFPSVNSRHTLSPLQHRDGSFLATVSLVHYPQLFYNGRRTALQRGRPRSTPSTSRPPEFVRWSHPRSRL